MVITCSIALLRLLQAFSLMLMQASHDIVRQQKPSEQCNNGTGTFRVFVDNRLLLVWLRLGTMETRRRLPKIAATAPALIHLENNDCEKDVRTREHRSPDLIQIIPLTAYSEVVCGRTVATKTKILQKALSSGLLKLHDCTPWLANVNCSPKVLM